MSKKYYLAYGSNLSMRQMAHRCPDAVYVGTAVIPNYHLLFKGSLTGSYLTIEKKKGSKVPVLVWQISEEDEYRLDRYEGCPTFYYKKEIKVAVKTFLSEEEKELDAIVYVMHEDHKKGCPSNEYYDVCREGYYRFGFDEKILEKALIDSAGKQRAKMMLEGVRFYV